MQFRGQDKAYEEKLGKNPNRNFEDEYIENLQQQIHFMELELKILKEKVIEDEKKSGIGSLYDDDKTSHQHIQLLKTKYAKMKRDHDRTMERLSKEQLSVIGEQFVLQAQIKIMRDQNQELSTRHRDYDQEIKKKQFEIEKDGKDQQRVRLELEAEIRSLDTQHQKQATDDYNNTMYLSRDKKTEEENLRRHTKEQGLNTNLITKKLAEQAKLDEDLERLDQEYQAMADLQNSIAEAKKLKDEIEDAKVNIQMLDVQVKVLGE